MAKFLLEIGLGLKDSDLNQAEQGFKRMGLSADEAGKHVQALAERGREGSVEIRAAMLRAAAEVERFAKAVDAGSMSATRRLASTTTATNDLRAAIEKTRTAGGPVDPRALELLQKAERQTDAFTAKLGANAAALEKATRAKDDAARAAGGFGKQITSVADLLGLFNNRLEQSAIQVGFWITAVLAARSAIVQFTRETTEQMAQIAKQFGANEDVIDAWATKVQDDVKRVTGPFGVWLQIIKEIRDRLPADFGNVVAGGSSTPNLERMLDQTREELELAKERVRLWKEAQKEAEKHAAELQRGVDYITQYVAELEVALQVQNRARGQAGDKGLAFFITPKLIKDTEKSVIKIVKDYKEGITEVGRAWEQTARMAADAFADIIVSGRASTEQLVDSILRIWAGMLADMLAQWIATQAKMAFAARAAGAAGGGGGAGGWAGMLGSLGKMFGLGGGAAAGAGGAGAGGAAGGAAAGGAGGAAAGGASGAWAAAGWAAVIVAAIMVAVNQIKTSGRAEVDTTIDFGGDLGASLSGRANRQGGSARLQAQKKAMVATFEAMREFFRAFGAQLDTFAPELDRLAVQVRREGQGKKGKFVVDVAGKFVAAYKDLGEALERAAVEGIKIAPSRGLSPFAIDVIKRSTAETMQQLQAEVARAMDFSRIGLPEVAANVAAGADQIIGWIEQLSSFSTAMLPAALDKISIAIRQFAGIEIPIEEQKKLAKAEIALKATMLEAWAADLKAQIELAKAQAEVLKADREISREGLRVRQEWVEGMGRLTKAEIQLAGLSPEVMEAQLKAIDQIIAVLKGIDIDKLFTPPDTGDLGAGRGSGRGDARRDAIADVARRWAQREMSDFQRSQDDVIRKWADLTKGLKAGSEALAEANKAKLRELQLLDRERFGRYLLPGAGGSFGLSDFAAGIQQFLEDLEKSTLGKGAKERVRRRFLEEQQAGIGERTAALGGEGFLPTGEIAAVRAAAQQLRAELAELAKQGADTSAQLGEVARAEAYRLTQIEYGLVDRLFGYLQGSAEFEAQRMDWARKKVELDFAIIEAQLRALGAFKDWADVFRAAKDAALAALESADQGGGTEVQREFHNNVERLGEAAERMMAAVKSLQEYADSLTLSAVSPFTPTERLAEAKRLYDRTIAMARGGNVEAMEAMRSVADAYLQELQAFTGGAGTYRVDFARILAEIRGLVGSAGGFQHFQTGGIVYDQRLVHVGERGPEAIIPLPLLREMGRGGGMTDKGIIKTLREGQRAEHAKLTVLEKAVKAQGEANSETLRALRRQAGPYAFAKR